MYPVKIGLRTLRSDESTRFIATFLWAVNWACHRGCEGVISKILIVLGRCRLQLVVIACNLMSRHTCFACIKFQITWSSSKPRLRLSAISKWHGILRACTPASVLPAPVTCIDLHLKALLKASYQKVSGDRGLHFTPPGDTGWCCLISLDSKCANQKTTHHHT